MVEKRRPKIVRTRPKTGAHWFVSLLQHVGVEFVFGTTGSAMPDIQDAMVVLKPPKWIQGLHEFVTVNAASGYALASGKAGVALVDRSVGTQNSLGAIYAAYLNSSPVVIFASSNEPGIPVPGSIGLHFVSNMTSMVKPWVKWSSELNSLDTLPEDVGKAFYLSLSETRAPTYLTLRQDLMAQAVAEGRMTENHTPYLSPRVPDDATLEKIVGEILAHDNPQVFTSNVGRHPEAVGSLVQFAHTFGIAVGDGRVFMNYPISDPLHVGFIGFNPAIPPELLPSTDLVMSLEAGLIPHQGFYPNVDVIDMASDPLHIQDSRAGGDYGSSLFAAIVRTSCDSKPTLDKLTRMGMSKMSKKEKENVAERTVKVTKVHTKLLDGWQETASASYRVGRLDPWSVGYMLNAKLSKVDVTWVNGTNSTRQPLLRTIELNQPGTYFSNPSGHLGADLGMAYGVALAYRHYSVKTNRNYKDGELTKTSKVVLCTAGDGMAVMGNLPSALWTCSHYGIGVLYVILNNACWGIEWPSIADSSQHWAKDANDFEFVDIDKPRIDFQRLAESLSVFSKKAETVDEFEEVLPSLLDCVKAGRPALLDVRLEKYTGPSASSVL